MIWKLNIFYYCDRMPKFYDKPVNKNEALYLNGVFQLNLNFYQGYTECGFWGYTEYA